MTSTTPNESVEVRVDFHKTRILPRAMLWNGRVYLFTSVLMVTPLKDGSHLLYDFALTDGVNDFRLRLQTESLSWILLETHFT